ncbi:hypothetical protein [Microbacterium sp. NPDC056569]|uniref:hypothetical protein n=1 Tax=Microbacterium sp. NPDC056569 TaxID=3345867 RepID=UPI00366BD3AA
MTQTYDIRIPLTRRPMKSRRGIGTIGQQHKTLCPSTGKTRYRDRATAREALDSCRWQRAWELASYQVSSRTETRIYRCPDPACHGGYHLTSMGTWHEKAA